MVALREYRSGRGVIGKFKADIYRSFINATVHVWPCRPGVVPEIRTVFVAANVSFLRVCLLYRAGRNTQRGSLIGKCRCRGVDLVEWFCARVGHQDRGWSRHV